MPHIAADLIANIEVTGAELAAFSLDYVSASIDTVGAGASAASAGVDALDAAARTLGASFDAIIGTADTAALALDLFGLAAKTAGSEAATADALISTFGKNMGTMAGELTTVAGGADAAAASLAAAGNAAALAEGGFTGLEAAALGADGALAGASASAALAETNIAGAGTAAATADGSIALLGADATLANTAMGDLAASSLLAETNVAGAGGAALGAEAGIAGAGTAAATSGGEFAGLEAEALLAETNIAGAGSAAALATPKIAGAGNAAATADGKMHGGSLAVAGLGVTMLGVIAIGADMASKFDYTLATIEGKLQVLGGATQSPKADMDALREKALELGRDTVFSAGQAADAMLAFARAGRPVKEIIDDDTQAALNLAGAVDSTVPDAATILANMMNVFHLKGPEASHAADVLTVAVLKSGQPLSAMATSMGQAANIAATLHIPISDVAASLADFMRAGVPASTAGSTFKTMLDHLLSPSAAAKKIMDEYNFTMVDSKGNFIGVSALAQEMHDKFGNLNPVQQVSIANTLGLQRGQQGLLVWMREGSSAIDATTAEMNKGHPAAALMAAKMDTLTGAMHQLKGSIDTVLIILGSAFVPMIRTAADHITALANKFINLDPHTQALIAHIFAGVGAALALSGGLSMLGGSLGTLLGPLKAVGAVMVDMGPWGWLAAAAIVGFALAWKNDWFGIQEKVHSGLLALGPAFDSAKAGAQSFSDSVGKKGLGQALTDAVNGIVAAVPQFVDAAAKLLGGLLTGFENHWKEFPGKISGLIAHIEFDLGDVAGYLVGTAIKLIAGLVLGIAHHWKEIPKLLLDYFILLPAVIIATIVETIPKVGIALIEGFINGLDQAFPGLKNKLGDLMHEAIHYVESIFGIASPSTVFLEIGMNIIMGMANGLAAAWNLVTTAFDGAKTWILGFFDAAGTWLFVGGLLIITGLNDGLGAAWHLIVDALQGAYSGIVGAFSNAGTWLVQAGKDAIQGLADGISSMKDTAVGAAQSIIDTIKNLPGISWVSHSPSQFFHQHGVWLFEGLKNGISEAGPAALQAASAYIDQITSKAMTPLSIAPFGTTGSANTMATGYAGYSGGSAPSSSVSSSASGPISQTFTGPLTVQINGQNLDSKGIVDEMMMKLGQARNSQGWL